MVVFKTDGMNKSEIRSQCEKDWSSESENNVVLRTASFGLGQQGLEVCARREDYEVVGKDNQLETRRGLHDDIIIPLGLIAVLRRQMKLDKKFPDKCWKLD
jgi:hypothetical protein